MSFSYVRLTEEQCDQGRQFPLLQPGIYDFEVINAEKKLSKAGNSMIELKLKLWDKQGKEFYIYDYLIGTENMTWKIRNFSKAVGLLSDYDAGTFNEIKCQSKSGKADIIYQKGKERPDGGYYKDKNSVANYIEKVEAKGNGVSKNDPFDDDVPF